MVSDMVSIHRFNVVAQATIVYGNSWKELVSFSKFSFTISNFLPGLTIFGCGFRILSKLQLLDIL